jgi:transcriptional regulator with XRE-family HTH domain
VERAERTPSIVQAERVARALGTTLSEMLAELEGEQESDETYRDASGRRLDLSTPTINISALDITVPYELG